MVVPGYKAMGLILEGVSTTGLHSSDLTSSSGAAGEGWAVVAVVVMAGVEGGAIDEHDGGVG